MKKALVLSLAAVLGLGFASFAQTLSGSWDTTIGITPTPVALGIDSELVVTYAVSGWAFTSTTVIDETGWLDQTFDVSGALGAFSLGSALDFSTNPVGFTSWEVTGGLSLAGVSFDATFTLVPDNTTLEIIASGTAGNVSVEADITFGVAGNDECDFDFAGIDLTIGFPFCCAEVESVISFTCDGFEEIVFTVQDIALPGITWATLGAELTFTVDEKDLVITPDFDFGTTACFDVYLTDPAGGMLFGDIQIVGIGLECEIGGVQFIGVSYWGAGAKPSILAGTSFWEAYQISTTDDGCCGPFDFDILIGFNEASLQLFEVSGVEANFSIQISTQFTFGMGLVLNLDAAPTFAEWTLNFLVEW